MSGIASRAASQVGQVASKAAGRAAQQGTSKQPRGVLQKGAKRDPELYILLAIMTSGFGLVGWHFGRKPTMMSDEEPVSMAEGTMPWQLDDKGQPASDKFKYQYHPGGDPNRGTKNAPSALHSVIVPNVNLPKNLHEKYNKWGKDDY